jgi:hypothetical protein
MRLRTKVLSCVIAVVGVAALAGPAQASGPCERLAQLGGEGSDPTACNIVFDPVCGLAAKYFGGCTT